MNITLNNPIGVDKLIDRVQKHIYDELSWPKKVIYGRVFKNQVDGKKLPQPYLKGKEYKKDAFLEDDKNAHVFFLVDDTHKEVSGPMFEADLKVVFMLNLSKVYPDNIDRADLKSNLDAWEIISSRKDLRKIEVHSGIEQALKGFDISTIKKMDIHPYHTFAIKATVRYLINN